MSISGGTFQTNEPLLKDLLERIRDSKLQLPDFQRSWVWDDQHIRSLIASVTLSYPVGAVMILQVGGQGVRFLPRRFEGTDSGDAGTPEALVLDGQQRLTSLFLVMMSGRAVPTRTEKGKDIKRFYYLDMERCLDADADRLDAVISVPESKRLTSDFGREIELDLTTRENELEHRLLPLSLVFDATELSEWQEAFREHYAYDGTQSRFLSTFSREIWLPLQQYKIPVIELKKETPKEAVCQVFEKVNTGGVSLTVFELMTATYAADDFQLREDWTARRERLREYSVLKGFGGKEMLQTTALLASFERHLETGSAVSIKRKDVLRLSLGDYRTYADRVEAGLVRAARLLNREKVFDLKNLPYGTQLMPLGATCAFLEDRFERDVVRQKLARWYWCGVFGELYGGANETRFALDIQDLCAWILEGGDIPRTIRDSTFTPTRLLTLQSRQSAAYNGLYALMIQAGSPDFMSGDPIAHTTGFNLSVDIHHLFPAAWAKKRDILRLLWNSVVNKAPLTARTNRILSGVAPSAYLQRIISKGAVDARRLEEILASHLLDPRLLWEDRFEEFMRDRAARLLVAIETATDRLVQGWDSEETVRAFGAPLSRPVKRP